jgi:hypothetical protein
MTYEAWVDIEQLMVDMKTLSTVVVLLGRVPLFAGPNTATATQITIKSGAFTERHRFRDRVHLRHEC